MSKDRSRFGERQAEMTARWYENVKAQYGDVDAYIAKRHDAYLDRWREAGRFIGDGTRVLDIGGGNLFPRLIEYLRDREFQYSYLDVDPSAVEGSKNLAREESVDHFTFDHGFNDKLKFPDDSFDAVFSSHCIEHSIDLASTFREINRVLVDGGNLLMAVPFGWELNPEHPYFLGPQEWISLVEDSGFRIRVAQVGNEYPEFGEDYFIAAEKISEPQPSLRIDPARFQKETFHFVEFSDRSVRLEGEFETRDDCVISCHNDSVLIITLNEKAREFVPVFHRHSWSGVVRLNNESNQFDCDLYSWFAYDMPVHFNVGNDGPSQVTIQSVGSSPASRWSQFVFKGYLWR